MFTFIGVTSATTADYMQYLIWRPVLRHDFLTPILIVESKHLGHLLAFVTREAGGNWLLIYRLDGSVSETMLDNLTADAKHREDLLNRYDGAEWFAQWRLR